MLALGVLRSAFAIGNTVRLCGILSLDYRQVPAFILEVCVVDHVVLQKLRSIRVNRNRILHHLFAGGWR